VTSVSGRGVGMDVVRAHIDRVGGTIDVKSVRGEGSHFTIRIPLTLAIISALIVDCGGQRFAMPRLAVVEILRSRNDDDCRVECIQDTPVLRLRGQLLPLIHLGRLLGAPARDDGGYVVVMQVGSRRFGVVVDGVIDVQEIVAKPLATRLRHIALLAGSTILGDGSVIMIVDPNGIARTLGVDALADHRATDEEVEVAAEKTSLLVFRAGSREPKAVPLSLVMRIEKIDVARVEVSDGRPMIQYRGRLMPLIEIGGAKLRDSGTQPVLVFADDGRAMGLVVDDIVDIAEEAMAVDLSSRTEGVIGSAVIRGQATEIVDIGHFLPVAFGGQFGLRAASATSPAILLIDDSAFFRDMLSPVLRAAGYRVTSVASAQEAFDLLRGGERYEAVLADTDMPEIDGFVFAATLRADDALRGLPLIALSATLSPVEIERAREAGFQDHVAKFDRIGLIAALRGQTAAFSRAA
jgi:two-component system chemotaxis sensor kinase CheA